MVVRGVDVGTGAKQPPHGLAVVHVDRPVQRARTIGRGGVDVDILRQEMRDGVGSTVPDRVEEAKVALRRAEAHATERRHNDDHSGAAEPPGGKPVQGHHPGGFCHAEAARRQRFRAPSP